MSWLDEPVSGFLTLGIFTWIVLGVPSLYLWLNDEHGKNPIKNMWMAFEEDNYNMAGKIILLVFNIILGLPVGIMYYLIQLVGLIGRSVVKLFNLIFKKKEK